MGRAFRYFHVSTLPRLHQIAWCRLPEGADLQPGSTVRPALIRGSKRNPTNGRGAVQVSYGNTNLEFSRLNPVDLIIQNFTRLQQLDLPHAVRFDLGLVNWLPWGPDFFCPPEHNLYIIAGTLTETEKTRLRVRLKRRGIITAL